VSITKGIRRCQPSPADIDGLLIYRFGLGK
jgi:hypothetical protein